MHRSVSAACLAASLVVSTAARADILFNFSFSGIGTNPGIVSGTLDFTAAGTNVAATSLYVTSVPNGYHFSNANLVSLSSQNSFTVTAANTITAENFVGGSLFLGLNGYDNELDYSTGGYTYNFNGLAGVTYVSTTPVPEPATIGTLLVGILGLVTARYCRANRNAHKDAIAA